MKFVIKKRVLNWIFVFAVCVAVLGVLLFWPAQKQVFGVNSDGMLRPYQPEAVQIERTAHSDFFAADLRFEKIIIDTKNDPLFGILVIPAQVQNKNSGQFPGVLLLAGAGASKESELELAQFIARQGFVVLIIDQRGVGESKSLPASLPVDYANFMNARPVYHHLMVFDALRAVAVLRRLPEVQKQKIIVMGESMGGRNALIAAALDARILGVFGISTSGFGIVSDKTSQGTFLASIDPDSYVKNIAPRKLAMIHNTADKNIPYDLALQTFSKANEPKRFFAINDSTPDCKHGYCQKMDAAIAQGLGFVIS